MGRSRILVTGASGFLGRAIVAAGRLKGHRMVAVSRSAADVEGAAEHQVCGDLGQGIGAVDLSGIDVVIHCAALVHQPNAEEHAYSPMNVDLPVAPAWTRH
ncbi:MAG: NAD-dependent epimerase/dehydratase family protein [Pseudomonadota bacterium]